MVMVAKNAGLNKEELLLILRNKNSILRALHLGELSPLTKEELASSSKKRTKFSSDLRIKASSTPLKEQFVCDCKQIITLTLNDDDALSSSQIDANNADTMQSPTPMPAASAAASQGKATPKEDQDSTLSDPLSDSKLNHIIAEPAPAVRRSIRSKRKHDTDAIDKSAAPSSKKRQRSGRAKGKGKAKQVFRNDKIVNSDDDAANQSEQKTNTQSSIDTGRKG